MKDAIKCDDVCKQERAKVMFLRFHVLTVFFDGLFFQVEEERDAESRLRREAEERQQREELERFEKAMEGGKRKRNRSVLFTLSSIIFNQ